MVLSLFVIHIFGIQNDDRDEYICTCRREIFGLASLFSDFYIDHTNGVHASGQFELRVAVSERVTRP